MNTIIIVIACVAAYLLGSVNTSIILSKLKGKDIRKEGSGNAGATNTLRVMGKKAAAIVALFDALKGIIAVLVARLLCNIWDAPLAVYLSALFVMLGHVYPIFFGFRGGKGVMTTIAVIFMLDWRIGLILFALCIAIMLITRYVSLGSCIGAALFPVLVAVFHTENTAFIIISVIIGALAIFKHKTNIARLLKGNESKLNFSK